jgi:hypothetical protein
MAIMELIVGILLLVLGRKLFWLYVAALGFAAGMAIASQVLHIRQDTAALIIAIGFGILGALLALFFQNIAIGVAGFLGGAYVAVIAVGALGLDIASWAWMIFIVGGIIGAALVGVLFEWALVFISSLAGASLIVEALNLARPAALLVAIILFVIGIATQTRQRPRHRRER